MRSAPLTSSSLPGWPENLLKARVRIIVAQAEPTPPLTPTLEVGLDINAGATMDPRDAFGESHET
jgi:hypothetical protein